MCRSLLYRRPTVPPNSLLGGMTKRPVMKIDVVEASESDATQVGALLDEYLRELSSYCEGSIGATDSTNYPYRDAYWSEPGRHAFFIQRSGCVVGFAFVRDPISTKLTVHEIAEFYVKPESRRQGVGRRAVLAIWQRFPGQWEVQVHARNSGAVQFWTLCAEEVATEAPQVRELQANDGRRIQFNFNVQQTA